MPGESIQCPPCGGSLDVGRSAVSAKCAYCGSTIQLKVDAAGQVLPVLEQMHQASSIVAKRAAMGYLEKQFQEWRACRATLESDLAWELKRADRRMLLWALVGTAVGSALGVATGMAVTQRAWFVFAFVGTMLGLLVAGPSAGKIKTSYQGRLREANEKIADHQARIQELQEEVARLAQTV